MAQVQDGRECERGCERYRQECERGREIQGGSGGERERYREGVEERGSV